MDLFFEDDPNILLESSSDDEIEDLLMIMVENEAKLSSPRYIPRKMVINRDSFGGHNRLIKDYFAESPVYNEIIFRRRFRMSRDLFNKIKDAVESQEQYFVQRRNAAGKLGLSSLQKITAAFRMLAYGITGDLADEYIRIGESTTIQSMNFFVKSVINIFAEEYLRRPNNNDIIRLLAKAEQRGVPGMLGSIDCMHWEWKNCPKKWSGQYAGRSGKPTIILEAVASYDTWIWHGFFGLPGSHNDINVLERSPVFDEVTQGHAPDMNYVINGHHYDMGYYLADGIYPQWATFVKSIPAPIGVKRKHFATVHESLRKDVERAFGVLQARFAIVRGPARYFHRDDLKEIMMACIIMHNMIVEDERSLHEDGLHVYDYEQAESGPPQPDVSNSRTNEVRDFINRHMKIRERTMHNQLQEDLIEHLWNIYSTS